MTHSRFFLVIAEEGTTDKTDAQRGLSRLLFVFI